MSSRRRPSRRDFLKGVGAAGAGVVAGSVGVAPPAAASARVPAASPARYARSPGAPSDPVDFGRIFPELRPFAELL